MINIVIINKKKSIQVSTGFYLNFIILKLFNINKQLICYYNKICYGWLMFTNWNHQSASNVLEPTRQHKQLSDN